jgi:ABC-type cobalamin/Fe3+-siderophores transport system ATPase subunit
MEEFFVISKRKLDKSWNLSDLHEPNNALDYCEQMLDIPEEHIVEASMSSEGLELTVIDADYDEDWYMQLIRVA